MPTLAFNLLAGRYHATPWSSLANEGVVEWPPSPWRLIRALLSAGFVTQRWNAVPDEARRLVEELASVAPLIKLPAGVAAHTRHWMPTNDGKTRVLDPFIAVGRVEPLLVHYPCELDKRVTEFLRQLAGGVSYLGRAESWVEAQLLEGDPDMTDPRWCRPAERVADAEGDQVPLLAPMSADSYAQWKEMRQSEGEGAARRKARDRASLPTDLVECLLLDTRRLQKEGWTQPPGSRWVLYTRPADALRPPVPRLRRRPSGLKPVEAMLLALAPVPGADGRRGVLPLLTRAVPQAELVHQSAIAMLGNEAPTCTVLTGRAANGQRLEGHGHAHYVPLDLDSDARLDHVLVYAPAGLDDQAQTALSRVTRTWTKDQVGHLFLRVVGRGSLDMLARQLAPAGQRTLPILDRASVWTSVTPFVPPRFLKKSRHTLVDQVSDELTSRGYPRPISVETLTSMEMSHRRLLSFVTTRREGKPQPPARCAFGLRLVFAQEVSGPIAIGYGSHFGLGLFAAEEVPATAKPDSRQAVATRK